MPGCAAPAGKDRPVCSPHWAVVPYPFQQAWWRQSKRGDAFTVNWLREEIIGYGASSVTTQQTL